MNNSELFAGVTNKSNRGLSLVTLAIFSQVFLAAVDTTIVSAAMPTVVAALGGLRWYSWVFSAYMIASTIATPIAGKLSDQFSRKRMYLASITSFLTASMLCGLSPNMVWLIVCRALQGLAGGTMFAISLGLVGVLFPPHQRGKMQGFFSSLWAIASIIGPPLGGYVVEHFSWRWTFYLNLPLGVLAIVFFSCFFQEPQRVKTKQEIDYAGAAVLSVLAVGLLFAVTNLDRFTPGMIVVILLVAVACVVLLNRIERRAAAPMVPLQLLRRSEIAAANLTTLTTGVCAFSLILFAPLFVQGAMLRPATHAGIVLLPFSVGWAAGSLSSGHLVNHFGYRKLAAAGAVLMILGFLYQITLDSRATLLQVSSACLAAGLGMGLVTTAITVSVQNNVEPQELGVATASTIFSRALGAAVGVSLLGWVLSQRVAHELRNVFPEANSQAMSEVRSLLLPESRAQISPDLAVQLQLGLSAGLHTVFLICTGVAVLAFLATLRVSSRKPARETGTVLVEGGAWAENEESLSGQR
jgi:EmrB/QacA subfamily drug resistance transporter